MSLHLNLVFHESPHFLIFVSGEEIQAEKNGKKTSLLSPKFTATFLLPFLLPVCHEMGDEYTPIVVHMFFGEDA